MPEYEHTQRGHWHLAMLLLAAVGWALALVAPMPNPFPLFASGLAALFALLGLSFMTLTVRDGGDRLLIRYGPIPLMRGSVRYDQITNAAEDRTNWLDGWGVHWVPGRGTTYNLWGFQCVRLEVGLRTIRLGTDDPEGLLAFLRRRCRLGDAPEATTASDLQGPNSAYEDNEDSEEKGN